MWPYIAVHTSQSFGETLSWTGLFGSIAKSGLGDGCQRSALKALIVICPWLIASSDIVEACHLLLPPRPSQSTMEVPVMNLQRESEIDVCSPLPPPRVKERVTCLTRSQKPPHLPYLSPLGRWEAQVYPVAW